MESMFPPLMKTPYRGRPISVKEESSRQLGWARIATRYPSASSTRLMMAVPKEGWST